MASTLLEETRQYHEDIERLERLIVKDFKNEARTHKDKLVQGHRVRQMLESLQGRASKLVSTRDRAPLPSRHPLAAPPLNPARPAAPRRAQAGIYEDADGARKEEIASLRGDNVFQNFYDRLKEVREYHRRFPADDLTAGDDDAALLGADPPLAFSGEEGLGRYLDLHEHHQAWSNSKFGGPLDYLSYVAALPAHLDAVPRAQRLARPYAAYVAALGAYLWSFCERTQPLAQLARQWERAEAEFAARWAAGEVGGWEDRGEGPGAAPAAAAADGGGAVPMLEDGGGGGPEGGALDLGAFDSADELEVLGAERLKAALAALGLKCGGTLRQRAERLMAVKGVPLDQVDAALFARGARPAAAQPPAARAKAAAAARAAALAEARVRWLCGGLGSVLADTVSRVEKRQAQTYEEMAAEQAEAEEEEAGGAAAGGPGGADEEEDEDEYIYNPLKLPLGWDGKPIPYWLYKLHGLNKEFKCEICGGASYWGRRAFERHFKEPQHQGGMRALGIPNTKQFFEITTIADALALWRSLQEREAGGAAAGGGGPEEEYEDAEGNVYGRQTYEDLKRQGII